MLVSAGDDVPSDHMFLAARIDTEGNLLAPRAANWEDCSVYEVGISYAGRSYAEGKKIGWRDGLWALWCILKYNLLR